MCKSWCIEARELRKCSNNQYAALTCTKPNTIGRGIVTAEAAGSGKTRGR